MTILICTQDNLILLFIVGIVVATVFEYVASLFLEKVFHMVLWDYSHLWGNIQGRVAPIISLFWGVGIVLLVKFIPPLIQRVINWEEVETHGALAAIVVLVMGTDLVFTIISVRKFHETTKMWDEKINEHLLKRLSWNHQPLMNSFAKIKFALTHKLVKMKHDLKTKGILK